MFGELSERGTSVTAILAALIAAVLYGTGAALQQHQAAAALDTVGGTPVPPAAADAPPAWAPPIQAAQLWLTVSPARAVG